MKLDLESVENRGLLAYLGRDGKSPPIANPATVEDPYQCCGAHPDVVERVWDQLGAGLPRKSRALVHGTPALVHTSAGVVLAIALGTSYALRLPAEACATPPGSTLPSVHTFRTSGDTLDLATFGPTWRFGNWHKEEVAWITSEHARLK